MVESILKISAGGRLDINRDSEVLNQFVRINLEEDAQEPGGDQRTPLANFPPHKPESFGIIKGVGVKRHKDERRVEFEDQQHDKQHHQQQQQQSQQPQQHQDEQQEQEVQKQEDAAGESQEQGSTAEQEKRKERIDQKQIKEELRKRRKKRKRPRPEEIYTDKDRAAAVGMGSRDIKLSLRIKRKQDRSKILQIPEEAEPSTFLALGKFEMVTGEPTVALGFFDKALELNPSEKNSLVARSKCYLLLGQPDNGLKDAEAALAVDKNFLKAIYQKAEALYYLGDFEHSLMYYHRGLRIRPEHEGFQLGAQKAQKAIENAIGGAFPGAKRSPALSSTSKSSGKSRTKETTTTTSSKTYSTKNTPEPKVAERTPKSSIRNTPMMRPKTVNKNSRLLRELKTDKDYLENLLKHPDLKCKNKEDDSVIVGYIQEAVDFLNTRQEFWRQQLPSGSK